MCVVLGVAVGLGGEDGALEVCDAGGCVCEDVGVPGRHRCGWRLAASVLCGSEEARLTAAEAALAIARRRQAEGRVLRASLAGRVGVEGGYRTQVG